MPKVSVVIPTHNRAALLQRAVRSVLIQTMEDLEVLVADDASQDATAEVVRSFGDHRIKYLRHDDNRGVSAARNTALAHAAGEYIAFLDDDDEWLPDKLRLQVERMEQVSSAVGAICCGHYEVDTATLRVRAEVIPTLRGRVFEEMLVRGSFNHTSTIVVRADCFRQVGVFDSALRYGEDLDMWLRMAKVFDFDYVPRPLVKLYFQANGLSQNYGAIVSGGERHLQMYRDFYARHPKLYSRRLHRLGTFTCFTGDLKRGRTLFCAAVRENPLSLRNYVSLFLTFGGAGVFNGTYQAKRHLDDLLGRTLPAGAFGGG